MTSVDLRRAQKNSHPVTNLAAKHTIKCQVLPNRQELLNRLPKNGACAEVGVAFGDFSLNILQINRPQKLYLIDIWEGDRYSPGLNAVKERLSEPLATGQAAILQGKSVDVLSSLPNESLDWVYIDTDHSYRGTLAELQVAAKKIKRTGIIAGHDFCTGNVVTPVPYGVVEACCKFAADNDWRFRYLTLESHGHFSFALERITPDAL